MLGAVLLALLGCRAGWAAGSQAELTRVEPAALRVAQVAEPPATEEPPPLEDTAGDAAPAPQGEEPSPAPPASEEPAATPGEEPQEAEGEAPGEPGEAGPRGGTMAPVFPGEPAEGRVIVRGSDVRLEGGVIRARGAVEIRSVQYTLRATAAEFDQNTQWATLRGEVVLQGQNVETRGAQVRANVKTGEWHLDEGGRAVIEPGFFAGGQVRDKLYLGMQEASAPGEEGPITLRGGQITSCSLEEPHYGVSAREIEIRPGRKVIARGASLHLLGRRILTFPFSLVLPLDERKTRYLPLVGRNDVEGVFAKFAFGYLMGELGDGVARLNLSQKRGVGVGFDHALRGERQQGSAAALWEPSQGALSSTVQHRYRITDSWSSDLTGSYSSNSGYFGSTNSLATSLLLTRRTTAGQTQVGYQRSVSGGGFGSSRREMQTFSQRQQLGSQGSWTLQGTLEDYSFGGSFGGQRNLDARFDINRRERAWDWSLAAGKLFELSLPEGQRRRYALNRMPAVIINTDSRRLGNYKLLGRVPFQAQLGFGQFEQQPDDLDVGRAGLDLRLGGNQQRWGKRQLATISGRFLQAVYTDASAQYILAGDFDWQYDLGDAWQTRLRYNHSQVHGFAPISLDYGSTSDYFSWQLVRAITDRQRIELNTGYDAVGGIWQDAYLRAEYMPSRRNKLTLQTGYSLEQTQWRPLSVVWTHVRQPALYLTLAAEYDPAGQGLTRATGQVDWQVNRQWRVAAISGYTGYSKRLDTLDVQVQRDLHCMIGTLTYSKALDEIMVGITIKAFPSPDQIMGIGRGGQQFQPLPGQDF